MSNENQEHDPVEELFRKKAEEYDIAYNEADWLRLEKRLNSQVRRRTRRNRRIWITAASILLFSLLGYFTYNNYQAINRLNEQLSEESAPPAQERSATTESDASNSTNPPTTYSTSPVVGADSTNRDTDEDQKQSDSAPRKALAEAEGQTESTATEPPAATFTASQNEPLTARRMSRQLLVTDYSCSGCALSPINIESSKTSQVHLAKANKRTELNADINTEDQPVLAVLQDDDNEVAVQRSSPFAIGIAAGPDLSTVGSFSNFSSPGYKVGVAIEYSLSENLAVSSGVGRANVRYSAHGQEYEPPYGYWTNGTVADETRAQCAILEIPVSLKYKFLHFENSRIYASAGVSSYIMLNEEYQFNYDQNSSGLVQNWSGQTGTRHWMSNASLSVGYELDILRQWSLRVEPFVNLPLKEVGWGNVELYSTGTLFSFNHKL